MPGGAIITFILTDAFVCSISTRNRLKYLSYPVLFLNFLMLLTPVLLIILVRGWFFTKSWRKRRARNTLVILLLIVFTIQVTPMPVIAASAAPGVMQQFLYDHLKERLALMYGGEENIPPLSDRVKAGYRLSICGTTPSAPPSTSP